MHPSRRCSVVVPDVGVVEVGSGGGSSLLDDSELGVCCEVSFGGEDDGFTCSTLAVCEKRLRKRRSGSRLFAGAGHSSIISEIGIFAGMTIERLLG